MKEPSTLLFAPGAGAPSSSPWVQGWARRLGEVGEVRTFDYPYQRAGRRRPDPQAALIAAHAHEASEARAEAQGRLFLAGKSMGSRIGCHVSLELPVDGLICFGYPLKGPTGALRDQVLLALTRPILFVQGTRDPLCPLAALDVVRARMKAESHLLIVEGGNHSLEIPKRQGPQDEVDARILEVVRAFVRAPG